MRIVKYSPYEVPPSSGTVWLDDNSDTWYSVRSKSVQISGRTYDLPGCACRKLNPGILVMQSAQGWATKNVPGAIDGARDRCIFLQ
jgi:hypothetical protein